MSCVPQVVAGQEQFLSVSVTLGITRELSIGEQVQTVQSVLLALSVLPLHVLNIPLLHVLNERLVLTVQAVLIHHLVPVMILSHVLNVQPVKTAQPVLNIIIQHTLGVLVALIVLTAQPFLNVQMILHILCVPLVLTLQLVLNALRVLIVQPVLNSLLFHLDLMISCVLSL